MKLKIFLLTILTLFAGLRLEAKGNDEAFKKLSNTDGVTVVVVSKMLLKMAGGMNVGVNIKGLSRNLDKIEIYTTENIKVVELMKQEMDKITADDSYEELVNIKEDGETTKILAKIGEKDRFKEMLLFTCERTEASIIRMLGSFTMEDLQQVQSQKSK